MLQAGRTRVRVLHGLVFVAGAAAAGWGCSSTASTADGGGTVLASEIIGPVPACADGFAHPNVCCRQGACVAHPDAPFATCAPGALLFPDRRRCCPLEGGACIDALISDAASSSQCALPCGPEGQPASAAPVSPVCGNGPVPGVGCEYCCSGDGCPTDICNGPASPDGGVGGVECRIPSCGACAAGWDVPAEQVDLCCASPTRCFSQSAEVLAPVGVGTLTSPDACHSSQFAAGHFYDLTCESSTSSCVCSSDGTITMRLPFTNDCNVRTCGVPPL
jgi:hypothetical protein